MTDDMLNNFFDPSYWFTLHPAEVGGLSGNIIFGIFVLLFVLGIIARIVASNKTKDRYVQNFGMRTGSMLITMGIIGIVLYFFSYERVYLLGARFWYVLWLIGLIVWAVFLFRFASKTVPEMRKRDSVRAQYRKYFPRRKK